MENLISEEVVVQNLTPAEALEAVRFALLEYGLGKIHNQERKRVSIGPVTLNSMSAAIPSLGVLGAKVYTTGPKGPCAYLCLYQDDGTPLCVMEADELGRIRTAAVSALATTLMARSDSKVMTLFGVGFQAETQLVAIAEAMSLREVRVFSRNPDKVQAFCEKMEHRVAAKLVPVSDAKAAVESSDIVTTSTSSPEPVLFGAWVQPGTHVNAIGNNRAYEREIDGPLVQACSAIVVDALAQARIESGDLLLAEQDGYTAFHRVHELSDVLTKDAVGRYTDSDITVFKSNGLALEDVSAAYRVYQNIVSK